MKRLFLIPLMIVLVAGLIFSGCAKPAPAPAPAPAPTPALAPAPAPVPAPAPPPAKPIRLKLATDGPPIGYFCIAADRWAKEVAKATEGRVVIDSYHASSLVSMTSAIESLLGGVTDLYILSVTGLPASFPVSQVCVLPGLAYPETMEGKLAFCTDLVTLMGKYPAISDEWKDFKIMFINAGPTYQLFSKAKEVRTPADISGMKVGCLGARQVLVQALGAAPVSMIPPLAYQSMQTGVIEAQTAPWSAVGDFKYWEVGKYLSEIDFGENALMLVISWNSWNEIPARDQQIMMELASKGPKDSTEIMMKQTEEGIKGFLDYGGKRITLTADERALWKEKCKVLWDDWISKQEARGVKNARDIFNARKSASDAAWGEK